MLAPNQSETTVKARNKVTFSLRHPNEVYPAKSAWFQLIHQKPTRYSLEAILACVKYQPNVNAIIMANHSALNTAMKQNLKVSVFDRRVFYQCTISWLVCLMQVRSVVSLHWRRRRQSKGLVVESRYMYRSRLTTETLSSPTPTNMVLENIDAFPIHTKWLLWSGRLQTGLSSHCNHPEEMPMITRHCGF